MLIMYYFLIDFNIFIYLMYGDMEGVYVKEVMGFCIICKFFLKNF